MSHAPPWAGTVMELATEATLVVLGSMLVAVGWTAVRRRDAYGVAATVVIGAGTVAAYAISEAVKLVVDEDRPCRVVRGAGAAIAECPEMGDWSFPSNHATLATGIAVGLALLGPRLAVAALPVAVAAASLRVLVGVHYPHDVLAGVLLGGTLTAAALLALTPAAARLVSPLLGRLRGNDAGLVGHHGRRRPVVHGQTGEDRADMGFDRPLRHVQAPGDLTVGQPSAEMGQDLAFPGGERVDPRAGGAAPAGEGTRAARREMGDHPGGDFR
jgi:undecaprenyl-diphosphatase